MYTASSKYDQAAPVTQRWVVLMTEQISIQIVYCTVFPYTYLLDSDSHSGQQYSTFELPWPGGQNTYGRPV